MIRRWQTGTKHLVGATNLCLSSVSCLSAGHSSGAQAAGPTGVGERYRVMLRSVASCCVMLRSIVLVQHEWERDIVSCWASVVYECLLCGVQVFTFWCTSDYSIVYEYWLCLVRVFTLSCTWRRRSLFFPDLGLKCGQLTLRRNHVRWIFRQRCSHSLARHVMWLGSWTKNWASPGRRWDEQGHTI